MKPRFSFGDAIGAPFVLIRQRPLAVFVWGSLMIAMAAAIYSLILPAFLSLPLEAGAQEAWNAYTVEMLQLQALSNGLSLLMYLMLLVIFNAAGRAALSPGVRDRFLFMRLGMDEVRVAVVVVGTFLGWYIALLVLILLGVGIGFGATSIVSQRVGAKDFGHASEAAKHAIVLSLALGFVMMFITKLSIL
jgi:Na+-driven multidrug efflux pump